MAPVVNLFVNKYFFSFFFLLKLVFSWTGSVYQWLKLYVLDTEREVHM